MKRTKRKKVRFSCYCYFDIMYIYSVSVGCSLMVFDSVEFQ